MDNYSPEKFTSDASQIKNVKYEMRYTMEKQNRSYPFTKLLLQILNSLKVIENEKHILYKTCRDFNLLDAFKTFDVNSRGAISMIELTTGLFELKVSHTQSELQSFFKYFDVDNSKLIKFSDFSKAFLPTSREQSL